MEWNDEKQPERICHTEPSQLRANTDIQQQTREGGEGGNGHGLGLSLLQRSLFGHSMSEPVQCDAVESLGSRAAFCCVCRSFFEYLFSECRGAFVR